MGGGDLGRLEGCRGSCVRMAWECSGSPGTPGCAVLVVCGHHGNIPQRPSSDPGFARYPEIPWKALPTSLACLKSARSWTTREVILRLPLAGEVPAGPFSWRQVCLEAYPLGLVPRGSSVE